MKPQWNDPERLESETYVGDQDDSLAAVLDELSDKVLSGEDFDLEAYCLQYPSYAERIRDLVPTLRAMQTFAEAPSESAGTSFDCPYKTLGDFQIVSEIGRGGMGVVYEAEQMSLGRRVALKVLPLAAMLDQRQLQRFRNEAQAAAMLKHPHIVTVYSVGSERGVHFYAMELIHGQSLAEVISELRLESHAASEAGTVSKSRRIVQTPGSSVETTPQMNLSTMQSNPREYDYNAAKLIRVVAEAIDYAHRQGVVHRDIKPSNLLIDSLGQVSIADFGLAQFQNEHNLTMSGDLLGTLRYMSPEQSEGNKLLDHRTDIYSLGLVLYELLTLQPAYSGNDRAQLLREIIDREPTPPRKIRPSIPIDLETITLKAINKDPASRYQSSQELADDLARFLGHQPILARRVSRYERTRRWMIRNPLPTMLIGLSLMLAILSLWFAIGQRRSAHRTEELLEEAQSKNYAMDMRSAYEFWHRGKLAQAEERMQPYANNFISGQAVPFELAHLWHRLQHSDKPTRTIKTSILGPAAVHPAGDRCAVASSPTTIEVWDLMSLKLKQTITVAEDNHLSTLAYSPAGTTLAAGTNTGVIYLFGGEDLNTSRTVSAGHRKILQVAITPEESHLVASDTGGSVNIRNLSDPEQDSARRTILQLEPDLDEAAIAISPDGGTMVVVGGWAGARGYVFRLPEFEQIASFDVSTTISELVPLAFSSDGRQFVTGGSEVTIWDTATWGITHRFAASTARVGSVVFSPDANLVAAGVGDRVLFYHLPTHKELGHIQSAYWIGLIQFIRSGRSLVVPSRFGLIQIWDQPDWQSAATPQIAPGLNVDVAFGQSSPSHLLGCCRMRIGDSQHPFGQFGVVDVRTGKYTELYQGTQGCFSIAISPTNPDLAAIATERTKDAWGIDLWDVRRGELVGHVGNEGDMPYDLAFSPDGEFLAASRLSSKKQDVGKQHSAVSIWQVADGSLAHEIVCSGSTDADFSPDGQFLAFCDLPDSECHVIDLRSEQRQKLTFTCKQAYQVKFIRNGTQVVCVGLNAELVVWDIANQQVTFKAQPADRLAVSLAVAPGDQTVAVGFEDCTVGLWHTATWTSMGSLSTPNLPLNLEFSPDGTKLVAGCLDGSIVVWDTDGRKQVFRDQLDAKD